MRLQRIALVCLKSAFYEAGTIVWMNIMPTVVKNAVSVPSPLTVRVLNECSKRVLLETRS
jgi:hypothetical protein